MLHLVTRMNSNKVSSSLLRLLVAIMPAAVNAVFIAADDARMTCFLACS